MLPERTEQKTYCPSQRQTPTSLYMMFYITMKTWNSLRLIDLQQKSESVLKWTHLETSYMYSAMNKTQYVLCWTFMLTAITQTHIFLFFF